MKLTAHTDYGLRMLMALAVAGERRVTIEEVADRHRISRNHLMKVAQTLVGLGLIRSTRGRGGGLTLAKQPTDIRIGAVVRALETDTDLVACLGDNPASCVFSGACRLTGALRQALEAFFAELDRLTLADVAMNRADLRQRLSLPA
ncbi:Rrf2 family transcriptional regulator [Bosea sp. BK604]|uniref:RrF2 family transcriptional regulator n=1 Tax=Bosea sp. BK604 TaxID=2512180 RepID=UPI00104DF65F|nr:Rrf2 family transcriptional regulator [Bosea sp. BK604]TCR64087.1 BadM/Rrf2 family transcriptional regulator [Bosea sp. BK604]